MGFEPTRLAAPPPQDGASASSATSAMKRVYEAILTEATTSWEPEAWPAADSVPELAQEAASNLVLEAASALEPARAPEFEWGFAAESQASAGLALTSVFVPGSSCYRPLLPVRA